MHLKTILIDTSLEFVDTVLKSSYTCNSFFISRVILILATGIAEKNNMWKPFLGVLVAIHPVLLTDLYSKKLHVFLFPLLKWKLSKAVPLMWKTELISSMKCLPNILVALYCQVIETSTRTKICNFLEWWKTWPNTIKYQVSLIKVGRLNYCSQ